MNRQADSVNRAGSRHEPPAACSVRMAASDCRQCREAAPAARRSDGLVPLRPQQLPGAQRARHGDAERRSPRRAISEQRKDGHREISVPQQPRRPSPRHRCRRRGTARPRRRNASTRPPPRSRNAARAEMAGIGAEQADDQEDRADDDMEAMKAGRHEEGRAIDIAAVLRLKAKAAWAYS